MGFSNIGFMRYFRLLGQCTILSFSLMTSIGVGAQATVDETRPGRYYMNGGRLSIQDLEALFSEPETAPHWELAIGNKRAANALGFIGGFGMGWFLAYELFPSSGSSPGSTTLQEKNRARTSRVMLAIGIGSVLSAAIFSSKYNKYSHRAAVEYNKKLKATTSRSTYLKLKGGDAGLSLSYNF